MAKRKKVKVSNHDATTIGPIADNIAKSWIAAHGTSAALALSRLVHEKIFATYKHMEQKYGEVN